MKTIADYMNDPEIINEPEALREIHAIRLMQQDETKDMTVAQRREYTHKKAQAFFAESGYTPQYVNFSGQGKLKPRPPAAGK
jgi:hypothetical protein